MTCQDNTHFWQTTSLEQMTSDQWEALCDRCARCCLQKLEDGSTGQVYYTRVACRLLDIQNCRCRNYTRRTLQVPNCMVLTPKDVRRIAWLPSTCAYRRLAAGCDLPEWHPLISRSYESIHQAGISVRHLAVPFDEAPPEQFHRYVIELD
jgi:uncharacterized cysteine cluster protein YcgN (CxxCxxCC family)